VSVGFYPARDFQPLVEIHRSKGRAYRHAGGLSTQDARFRQQWRRVRGRVRERCLPPIAAEKLRVGNTVIRHAIH